MKRYVRILGLLLCVVAGVLLVSGILVATRVGSCGDVGEQACPSSAITGVFKIFGGAMLLVIGSIMTLGAGFIVGCLSAAVTLLIEGHGTVPKLVAPALIVLAVLVLLAAIGSRRTARIQAAEEADFKARAVMVPGVVTLLKETGMTVNDNPRVAITVAYQRTDGTSAEYETKMLVSRLAIPRVGDTATLWYDHIGQKATMELLEPTPPPVRNAEPEDSVPGNPTIVTDLERLAALRRDGSLSEDEYTLAKQRLLNG